MHIVLLTILIISGCGGSSSSSAPTISYYLERSATGVTENALIIEFSDDIGYEFQITGSGFDAEIAMDEFLEIRERTLLTYAGEGDYELGLVIKQPDGVPFIDDTLTWEYSTLLPDDPIVSFSEKATADDAVILQIASSRAEIDNEIWVQGDLAGDHADGGFWDTLSPSGLYPLTVTSEDGLKNVTVKLRNIYGNESEETTASILKKSQGPTNCLAELSASKSSSTNIPIKLTATNDGTMYYAIYGDVDAVTDFTTFTSGSVIYATTSSGVGAKNLRVQMRDAANTYCPEQTLTVTIQNGYQGKYLVYENNSIWSNSTTQPLNIQFDHYPSEDPMQMKITGDVTGDNVGVWLDYATSLNVELTAGTGERTVYAQFRASDGSTSFLVSDTLYLNPAVSLTDAGGGQKNVIANNIDGIDSITITGCSETFFEVDYASSYLCTPNAATVDLKYNFSNATTKTVSATP